MENKSILYLTLNKKWFQMILSGEKTEEYRDIKEFWSRRFCRSYKKGFVSCKNCNCNNGCLSGGLILKHYDIIKFTNGYGPKMPSFFIELLDIKIGKAKPEWSDNWPGDVFILKLGKIIKE